MTLRDPEVLEVLRDEPELLALADAFAETQRLRRPHRTRRAWPRALAVAGVAAVVVLAILLAPDGGGRNPILGRALAAMGDGRVLHLVMRIRTGEVLVDLKSGRRIVGTAVIESWSDRDSRRAHLVMRVNGQVADALFPEDMGPGSSPHVDPAFEAFWTGYRKALANGEAKLEGKGVVAGHPVYWLHFPPSLKGFEGTRVAIDRRTYKPVLMRTQTEPGRGGYVDYRVLTAETVPYQLSEFKRLGPSLLGGGGGGSASFGGRVQVGPQQTPRTLVVKAPWLTAGTRVAGLKLTSVERATVITGGRRLQEIDLTYGTRAGRRWLTIRQLRQPDEFEFWKRIPRGHMSIEPSTSADQHGTYRSWRAQVVRHGVYVTIETGLGESALLATVRALHPAP